MENTYVQKLKAQTSIANSELEPVFNAKVTALKNSLAANTLALTQQKTGVNANYDTQVTNQNIGNNASKNNFNAVTTSRGIGRSSIAATGIAEMDQINNRYVGAINQGRTGALGDIDNNIALGKTNYNNTYATMQADKQTEVNNLAHNYADKQVATEYQAGRDKVADNHWTSTNNYNIGRDKAADSRYASETATANSRYASEKATDNSRYATTLKASQAAVATDNSRYADTLKAAKLKATSPNTDSQKGASITGGVNDVVNKMLMVVQNGGTNYDARIKALDGQINTYNSMAGDDAKYLVKRLKQGILTIQDQRDDYYYNSGRSGGR